MNYRLLGRSGLRVSELCLGGGTFGVNWGPHGADEPESRRIFDAFAATGGNFIDTSNRYQEGQSEAFVGKFIEGRRDRFVIGTKYSLFDLTGKDNADDPNACGNRKNMVRSVRTQPESTSAPTTSTCCRFISTITPRRWRRSCGRSTISCARARCFMSAPRISRVVDCPRQHIGRCREGLVAFHRHATEVGDH